MGSQEREQKQDDGITLKELFLTLGEWQRFLWSKWKLLLLGGVIGAAIGVTLSFVLKPTYIGRLTFVLEEDEGGNPLGAYVGLASQFGINLGGGQSGVFSGSNIIHLLQSRLMIERALLSESISASDSSATPETLVTHYIRMKGLKEKWKNEPLLANISYPVGVDRSEFSLQQDSVLKQIYLDIKEDHLRVEKPDKEAGVIEVRCEFEDEQFAQDFAERLVEEVTTFYIQTKTHRSRENIGKLQLKADSIEALLNEKAYTVASRQDLNMNTARMQAMVPVELAARDKAILQTVYGEVVKNLEMNKLALLRETPLIQIIDRPILPLEKNQLGKIKAIFIGGVIGGFFMLIVLVFRKIYREIMSYNG